MQVNFLSNQFHRHAIEMFIQPDISVLMDGYDAAFLNLEADGVQRSHAGALDLFVLLPAAIIPTGHIRVVVDFQSNSNRCIKSF